MSIHIDTGENVAILTFSGEVSREQILGTVETLFEHPEFNEDFARVYDFTGLHSFTDFKRGQPLGEQLKDFLAEASQRRLMARASGKMAIVVPTDFSYGISRAYDAFASNVNHQDRGVFRTMDEALAWIRLVNPDDD